MGAYVAPTPSFFASRVCHRHPNAKEKTFCMGQRRDWALVVLPGLAGFRYKLPHIWSVLITAQALPYTWFVSYYRKHSLCMTKALAGGAPVPNAAHGRRKEVMTDGKRQVSLRASDRERAATSEPAGPGVRAVPEQRGPVLFGADRAPSAPASRNW